MQGVGGADGPPDQDERERHGRGERVGGERGPEPRAPRSPPPGPAAASPRPGRWPGRRRACRPPRASASSTGRRSSRARGAGSSGPHHRQLGSARQPAQDVVERARAAPAARPGSRCGPAARGAGPARPGAAAWRAGPGRATGRPSSRRRRRRAACRSPSPAARDRSAAPRWSTMTGCRSGERISTSVPAAARRARPPSGRSRGTPGRTAARAPSRTRRWRVPAPYPTSAPLPPTTRSPTRSPVRTWCSASAAAARTVRSRRARGTVDAAGATDLAQRVDHEQHAGVGLGQRVDDVQLARAQRDPPVDAPQPVAGHERPDAGQLGAAAHPARAVGTHEAERLRRLRPGVERRRDGQHRHRPAAHQHRAPPEAAPPRRQPDPLLPQVDPSPAARAEPEVGAGAAAEQATDRATRGLERDVRRLRRHPGHLLEVVGPLEQQAADGALALVQDGVGERRVHASAPAAAGGPVPGRPAGRTGPRARRAPARRRRPPAPARPRPPTSARRRAAVGAQLGHGPPRCSRVAGVATSPRTASTTRRPEASVIQSSGLTVIRWARTERATALTSSGMT